MTVMMMMMMMMMVVVVVMMVMIWFLSLVDWHFLNKRSKDDDGGL